MDAKRLSRVEVKDEDKGEVVAVFATLDVIDSDQDVTVKGAFEDGAPVRISSYGHTSWEGRLPVGKGAIREVGKEALMEGRFFLDTAEGRDTFTVVKNLGELQEWSYGYDPVKFSFGEHEGQRVRFLEQLKVHEVSPVLLGAGVRTRTVSAKSGLKFVENAEAVLADLADLHTRASEVVALRAEKGKGLAPESADALSRIAEAAKRFGALAASATDTDSREWSEALDLLAAAATLQGAIE